MAYDFGYADTKSPRQARRSPIGYGEFYFGEDEPVASGGMPLGMRDELLDRLGDQTSQFTSTLLGAIDYPGSLARDFLAGAPLGSRTTGEQLLEAHNLLPDKDSFYGLARPAASFLAEAIPDPLNLMTFGAGATSKAAKAAKAANIFDDAQRAASRALINSGGDLGKFGDNAAAAFKTQFGKGLDDLTDADLAARPLVGPRMARRNMTLEELVDAQPAINRPQAIRDIDNYLARYKQSYADIAGEKIGGDIGFRLPFSDTSTVFNLPIGGESFAKGLDRFGQAARWSTLGRHAVATFDKGVAGATDEGTQILARQITNSDKAAEELARRKTSELLLDLPETAYDPKVGSALRNVIEGTANVAERRLVNADPGLVRFADNWRATAKQYIDRSKDVGIGSRALVDKFGTEYFPRVLDDLTFDLERGNPSAAKAFSVMTGDQLSRKKSFHVPGGTKTLQELSLDPNVAGPGRRLDTDREAAEYIHRKLNAKARAMFPSGRLPNGRPARYGMQSARRLARTLHRLNPEAVAKKFPIFGQHPVEAVSKYIGGRERALGRANVLYDILGSNAIRKNYLDVDRQSAIPLSDAFRSLRLKTTDQMGPMPAGVAQVQGAKAQILERLNKRFSGIALDELKDISIDRRLMDRLNRIADFYAYPEAQSKALKLFDNLTRLWKGSILSWPARFVRDWYSGMFSNFIEVGSTSDMVRGYAGIKYALQGQWDRLEPILEMMPRYAGKTPEQKRRLFLTEMAGGGILTGRRITDIGEEAASVASGTAIRDEYLPGISPQTTLGYQVGDMLVGRAPVSGANAAYSELGKNWKGLFGMGTINPNKRLPDEITNPILRWSNKLGNTTDTINRGAGYISLLLQGVSPQEAAKRIKLAHVDYSSLTKVEREWFRRVIPFWAYTSRIGKYVATTLYNDPGGRMFQFGIRLPERLAENSGGDEYVPSSIRSRYGMSLEPLRDIPYVSNAIDFIAPEREGSSAWLADVDLPGIDQLNMLKVQSTLDGKAKVLPSAWSTFQSFAGQGLNPAIKTTLEGLTGQDFYTMRSKQSSPSTMSVLGRRAGIAPYSMGDRALGLADPLVQLVPFAPRVLQTARRLTDPNIQNYSAAGAQALFNAATGVKVQNITDEIKRWDALEKINESLEGDPNLRIFEQTYIPEEARPFTDPEVLELYDLKRQLNREQRGRDRQGRRLKRGPNDFFSPLNY